MQAPTDGASLRLLLGVRRRRTQGACSSLPPGTPTGHLHVCLPLRRSCHASSGLTEQACGCSSVRGGGGLKVRARQCHRHSNQAPTRDVFAFVTEPPCKLRLERASLRLLLGARPAFQRGIYMCVFAFAKELPCKLEMIWSKVAAAPRCEAEVASRCVLVCAAGTPTRHLHACVCRCDGAAMQAPD